MRIGWLNPRLGSENLGDIIIEDAVRQALDETLDDSVEVVQIPTQTFLTLSQRRAAASCDHFVVGGTNLLNGNIPRYIQWRIDPHTFRIYEGRVTLLGVGWWQYQPVNSFSRGLWSRLLSGGHHSVRDGYTADRLEEFGLSATNTGCPTMWHLPARFGFDYQADRVIATVTDYHRNHERDASMLRALSDEYDVVQVWLQGSRDREYLDELGVTTDYIEPTVEAFERALGGGDVDYFGTRLHAGVRALQRGVRTTIVAVDNRAVEISRDTWLPVLTGIPSRDSVQAAASRSSLELHIPRERIDEWKREFSAAAAPLS